MTGCSKCLAYTSCKNKDYVDHQLSSLHRFALAYFSEERLKLINCGDSQGDSHDCFSPGILGPILTEQGNFYDKSFFLSGLSHGNFSAHPSLHDIPSGEGAIPNLPAYVYGVFLTE